MSESPSLQTLVPQASFFWNFWGRCGCSVIFCEAVAIYGVIVAIILQTKLENTTQPFHPESMRAGYSLFASGIIVGFANLVCGFVLIFSPSLSELSFHCNFLDLFGRDGNNIPVDITHLFSFLIIKIIFLAGFALASLAAAVHYLMHRILPCL
jgi:F0F1-type ATP synthase membrane subunit c/vacuolar-type H+-ATPase subunit K